MSTRGRAEALVDWMTRNDWRLSQVQGFGYGEDRNLLTVRDCWKRGDQIVWQRQSSDENYHHDHSEMMRQITIYQLSLALDATEPVA